MPYASTDDLPPSVKDHLPQHAREIFRAAFNAAYDEHGEVSAFRIAWAAVKKRYRKIGDRWVQKDRADDSD
jgi:cation transport regulator